MLEKTAKYVLLQTAVPDYRSSFLTKVKELLGDDFMLIVGSEYFDSTITTRVNLGEHQASIRNFYFANRKLCFQIGRFLPLVTAERLIMEMNPRLLSNWPLILIRKLLRRSTCLWGHAWTRKGKGNSTYARDLMARLAGNVMAYTTLDADDMRQRLPRNIRVFCAPNALYPANQISDRATGMPFRFLWIGRLVSDKKPELAAKAFASVVSQMPGSKLTIVGSGPVEPNLRKLIANLGIEQHVELLGHISDVGTLGLLYGESICSLSPGYVGLSAIQSFSFGTPMLIAENEPHSPEIAAVIAGRNSLFFKSDDAADFSRALKQFWDDREYWVKKRPDIAADCGENYSTDRMAAGFVEFYLPGVR